MPRREIDTSRAVCDTCGRPYQDGDAVYSIADRYDEDVEDRDVLVSFRHWDCHVPVSVRLERARTALGRAEEMLNQLREKVRR